MTKQNDHYMATQILKLFIKYLEKNHIFINFYQLSDGWFDLTNINVFLTDYDIHQDKTNAESTLIKYLKKYLLEDYDIEETKKKYINDISFKYAVYEEKYYYTINNDIISFISTTCYDYLSQKDISQEYNKCLKNFIDEINLFNIEDDEINGLIRSV